MLDLVLLGILFWLIWRQRSASRRLTPGGHKSSVPRAVITVRCQKCGLHLPEEEAVSGSAGGWFCSQEHAREGRNGKDAGR